MGFEANGVPNSGIPGGGDLVGTLVAGRIPVANGIKSLTSSDSTYVAGVLTMRAASGIAKLTIDGSDVTSLDGATVNVRTSAGHINILSSQSIFFSSTNITNNRVPFIGTSGRFETGTTTSTELGYLTGVTSPIQTQLNNKATGSFTVDYFPIATGANTLGDSDAIYKSGTNIFVSRVNSRLQVGDALTELRTGFGGAVSSIGTTSTTAVMSYTSSLGALSLIQLSSGAVLLNSNGIINIDAPNTYLPQLTASRALVLDSSKQIVSSVTTSTELSYVNGVTSPIQAQINAKMGGSLTAGYMPYASAATTLSNTGLFYNGSNRWGFLTATPDTTVHIVGSLKFVDGNQGTNKVLTSDAAGVATWQNGFINPMTTLGDIIYGGASGTPTRLPIGTNAYVLTVNSGIPSWQPASGGFTNPMSAKGDVIQGDTGGTAVRLAGAATGNALISGGVGSFNSWGKIGLTTHISGTLAVGNGGTGLTSVGTGEILVGSSGNLVVLPVGSNGQVLTLSGGTPVWSTPSSGFANPMTTTGDIIQSTSGSTPGRLAAVATGNVLISGGVATVNSWGKVGLTTHVSGILPQANGGTGSSTVATQGAIPYQGGSSAYVYDDTNFNYDASIKTLNVFAQYITPGPGIIGQRIFTTTSYGQQIVSGGGGIDIVNTAGLTPAININSSTYKGIVIQSGDMSIDATSALQAGVFAQVGNLLTGTTTTANALSVYRNYTLNGTAVASGALLELNDSSAATGNFLTVVKQNVTKLVIKSTGVLQYIDGNQGASKVLTSDGSGNVSWATASGTTYTFSTGLTNTSSTITNNLSTGVSGGQSVIGGTAANNALTLSSTTNASKGKIFLGTASVYNEFNDRLGIGTTTPGSKAEIWVTNGGSCLRIVNSDATTAAGGTIVGWSWTPITNGSNTNLGMYENDASAGFTGRVIYHSGGNVTIGAGSGNGDAKLHVIGTIKIQDGSQGNGKILTSDANGLATWSTSSGFSNPMTTIGDIIQANTGGTPQRLAGSSTAGTFLRSGGSSSLNDWSTLVLPNTAATNNILYATGTNVIGSSSNFTYSPSAGYVAMTSAVNDAVYLSVLNTTSGTFAGAKLSASNSSGAAFQVTAYSSSTTGKSNSIEIVGTTPSGGAFDIISNSSSPLRIFMSATEAFRITSTGVSQTGSNPSSAHDLKAGTSSIAPLKFASGTNKTTAAAGEMEYDGTNLFFTRSGTTRENVLTGVISTGSYTPSTTTAVRVNINGTNYNLVTAP